MSLIHRALGALIPGAMFPWSRSASTLHALVYSDIYGSDDADLVTRETAMRCAPVKRARAVIIGRLADLPLELGTFDADGRFIADAVQPDWTTATGDRATTPWLRMAGSLDDLLFYGWCLWAVTRDDSTGAILDGDRIDPTRWRFDQASPTGVSIALGEPALWAHVTDPATVLLFKGGDDGLLENARDSILGWRHMERAWTGRVRNPLPLVTLNEVTEGTVSPAQAQEYVAAYQSARMAPGGAVGFLPATLKLEVHGQIEPDLFDKGRNAARIDIANHVNLPVSYLDGSTATSSLTYTTQEGTRAQIIDDLEYWLAPLEARLSEADVTGAAARVVRFNRSNLTRTPNDDHGPERDDTTPAKELTA